MTHLIENFCGLLATPSLSRASSALRRSVERDWALWAGSERPMALESGVQLTSSRRSAAVGGLASELSPSLSTRDSPLSELGLVSLPCSLSDSSWRLGLGGACRRVDLAVVATLGTAVGC